MDGGEAGVIYPTGVTGPILPSGVVRVAPLPIRPASRDLEWNRLIKNLPIHAYCDWVNEGRPGFADMNPATIREWVRKRNIP